MSDILEVDIPRDRSELAREVLEHIAWRGYLPPEAGDAASVRWQLPIDQIDLIRSVLKRNRRQAGESPADWRQIDWICDRIAEESRRTGKRPRYGPDDAIP